LSRLGGAVIILIRGTEKLLRRLETQSYPLGASTNALGDWYANLVYVGRMQLVLCTSANSLLSVVFEARNVKMQIANNLCEGIEPLLFDLGIAESQVRAELDEMIEYHIGPTASRSILGSMNEFMVAIHYRMSAQPDYPLRQMNLELSGIPCKGPHGYAFPADRAKMLLTSWHRECNPTRQ
jgi:hypothetical protein